MTVEEQGITERVTRPELLPLGEAVHAQELNHGTTPNKVTGRCGRQRFNYKTMQTSKYDTNNLSVVKDYKEVRGGKDTFGFRTLSQPSLQPTFPRLAFVRDFGALHCQSSTKAQLEN